MRRLKTHDPYSTVIDHFNRNSVCYVIVGMAGINYYASNASEVFVTSDFDFLIKPTFTNVTKAIKTLERLYFQIGTATGIFKPEELKNIVRHQQTIVGTTTDGIMVELLLRVSGYSFSEMEADSTVFTAGDIPVRVGRLTKLLNSKRIAGRPKDRHFLKRYTSEKDSAS